MHQSTYFSKVVIMIWSINSMMLVMALTASQLITVIGVPSVKKFNPVINEVPELILEKINGFSLNLFKKIESKKNMVVSPLSVWTTLSMALVGSNGTTRSELLAGLHLTEDSLKRTLPEVRKLIKKLNVTQMIPSTYNNNQLVRGVELRLANKMFVKKTLEIDETFRSELNLYYNSLPTSLDFTKSKKASKTINNWVSQQTNGRITNFVDPNMIDRNAAMIFINTLYFNGGWVNQFQKQLTGLRKFHLEDGTIAKVRMMFTRGEFKYGKLKNQHISFIELPYKSKVGNDAVSMFIIIPDKTSNLKSAEGNIENLWLNNLRVEIDARDCEVLLPKFKIESSINLQSPLEKLRIKSLFTNDADFSHIAKIPIKVSSITQKVVIEVNEKGTEATAATEISTFTRNEPDTVLVNKPFLFLICTKEVILFSGKIVDPRQ